MQTKGDEDEDHQQDNLHRQGNLNPDLEIVAEWFIGQESNDHQEHEWKGNRAHYLIVIDTPINYAKGKATPAGDQLTQ